MVCLYDSTDALWDTALASTGLPPMGPSPAPTSGPTGPFALAPFVGE
eukprot:CAMPEP_0173208786 /NCGR_PEP_ID=MMETSP1141-20130122/22723_1 /TAXON_ID=483371 /ORGANISM="non described non described, Strain CCMP2298" /LENGTH=46 /DNA_ID= /DNA_START= /DNA_END= /DNA_ORIENTATION=